MRNIGKLTQKGDTIVEVLISVAIVGLILTISYALANRSTQNGRQAQERTEAQKLAEGQFEQLRQYLGTGQPQPTHASFCMFNGAPVQISSPRPPECNMGTDSRYEMQISVPAQDTYRIYSEWDSARGTNIKDSITIHYKLPATAIPTFNPDPDPRARFNITVSGLGSVTGGVINCRNNTGSCSESRIVVSPPDTITYTAFPDPGATVNWSGAGCVGAGNSRSVTFDIDKACTVTFTTPPPPPQTIKIEAEDFDPNAFWLQYSVPDLSNGVPFAGVLWQDEFNQRASTSSNFPNGFSSITVRASADIYPEPRGIPVLIVEIVDGSGGITRETVEINTEPSYRNYSVPISKPAGTYTIKIMMQSDDCGCNPPAPAGGGRRGQGNGHNTDRNIWVDWLEFVQ